jgi:predicted Zn-dependent protease with MMP-like domain
VGEAEAAVEAVGNLSAMTQEDFEEIVNAGIDAIPDKFLELMDNVAIVIEDEPSHDQIKKMKLRPGWTLFGLYEGVPQLRRGFNYTAVLPDKITIFQKSIEQAARTPEEVKALVRDTVWHEIAHHFGMDEEEVEAAEQKRITRKNK